MKKLTARQEHVLVALLNREEELEGYKYAYLSIINAGELAGRLGFTIGPRQSGNGAKDGRSFSGYGSVGKWVHGSLQGLERKGLVYSAWPPRDRSRIKDWRLTDEGERTARDLRDSGVKERDPEAVDTREKAVESMNAHREERDRPGRASRVGGRGTP